MDFNTPQPDMLAQKQARRAAQAAEVTKRAQEMSERQALTQQRDVANRARIAQDAARLRSRTGPDIDQLMSQMGPGQNLADMAATKAAIAAKNTANQSMSATPVASAKPAPQQSNVGFGQKNMGVMGMGNNQNNPMATQPGMKRGGSVKKYAKGGSVSSASSRADGCCTKGKTKGKYL